MPMKIFNVKNGSYTEQQIRKLIDEGVVRLPLFEKEMGLLDFCLDLEVIENPEFESYILMISGYAEHLNRYVNDDLEEITQKQLNATLLKGKIVNFAGTHELIEDAGYQLEIRKGDYCEVVLNSIK
ncbi:MULTISPECIES: hypothetical protein [Bacillus cereus group]|uniref:hypothetical protein n=1 Tax=Bacillus cereus group sp. BfR-BA-01356 TaxID=2920319 RepID=UPI001F58E7AA|nr:hypothetical protein [Bacillus cereus]MEC3258791.1 hypothetical protein [Bacillus cereus]